MSGRPAVTLALVVAMDENRVIGAKGGLPWRISDDLKWFKSVTMGKPVVMGRKTFDSIGKPLPGRENIVVTRSPRWAREGVTAARDIDEALAVAADGAARGGAEEVCVIGGAEIYRQTLPLAGRLYLTRVAASVKGDAFFPPLEADEWRETAAGGCEAGPRNDYSCRFFILDRVSATL